MKDFLKTLKIKLLSRRFQILIVGCCAFFLTDKFSEQSLLILMGIYIGSTTADKIVGSIRGKE